MWRSSKSDLFFLNLDRHIESAIMNFLNLIESDL